MERSGALVKAPLTLAGFEVPLVKNVPLLLMTEGSKAGSNPASVSQKGRKPDET